jgi:hypothetical protein
MLALLPCKFQWQVRLRGQLLDWLPSQECCCVGLGCLLMLNQLNEAHGASFTQVTMSILSHDTLAQAKRCIPHLASITDTYNRAIDSPKKVWIMDPWAFRLCLT